MSTTIRGETVVLGGAVLVLAVHATLDSFLAPERGQGGEELSTKHVGAAREPKRIWRVADSSHTAGFSTQPDAYERLVVGFFDKALGADDD